MQEVDVTGIDNHEINALKVVDATAKIITQRGEAIGVFRQYAYHGQGRTIHSSGQLEWYKGNRVQDRSLLVGGCQTIKTLDGYVIPIDIINGLPYIQMQPNTDQELKDLPHVIFTEGAKEWDPTILDCTLSEQPGWYNIVKDDTDDGYLCESPFDEHGDYRYCHPTTGDRVPAPIQADDVPNLATRTNCDDNDDSSTGSDMEVNLLEGMSSHSRCLRECFHVASNINRIYVSYEHDLCNDSGNANKPIETNKKPVVIKKKPINYEKYRDHFLGAPTDKIKATFEATTQFATNVMAGDKIQNTIKSPYPANNVRRRNEKVASDVIFASVPAVDDGSTMAQLFIGHSSLVSDAYGMKNEAQFVNTFEDNIHYRGAMDMLITNSARVETSKRVKDIMRALCIDDWQSKPNFQHQNFAEHWWKHIKRNVEWLMNCRKIDADCWLLVLIYVCDVMNMMAEKSLGNQPPLQVLNGTTVDISIALYFILWDIVYVSCYEDSNYNGQIGSKKSSLICGRMVGFSWNVGHALTFKVLTDDTRKIIS